MSVITGDGRKVSVEEADALANGLRIEDIPDKYIPHRDEGLSVETLRAKLATRGAIESSERINRARLNGEPWAIQATSENISRLPERQMVAFLWFYWGGMKTSKVAEQMNTTDGTVRQYLMEARKWLEKQATKTRN